MGVTAASAIQSLQEAGGKTSRWHTEQYKDAFREMVEQIMWVLSEYMTKDRTLRIVGGWDSTGQMKDRVVSLRPTAKEGDALPKPAYTVRVQVQRNNPLQIQSDNEFLMQAAQICAQNGSPMPPTAIINLMQGYRNKDSVLRAVIDADQIHQQLAQLTQQNEQLQAQLEQQRAATDGMRQKLKSTQGGGAILAQQPSAPKREANLAGIAEAFKQQAQG
jgi:hypothetical protein